MTKMCRFRVDIGADVTAIPLELFTSTYVCELKPVHEVLSGPQVRKLLVQGKF